jgi:hypothetical protein
MSENGKLGTAGVVAAFVVLAAWLALVVFLMLRIDTEETHWARLMAMLGSVEAVAFAAAGALFGTTVQKQRVEEAKEQAQKADQRASTAEQQALESAGDAANGRALAAAIKSRRSISARASTARVNRTESDTDDDLLALAQRLFPD